MVCVRASVRRDMRLEIGIRRVGFGKAPCAVQEGHMALFFHKKQQATFGPAAFYMGNYPRSIAGCVIWLTLNISCSARREFSMCVLTALQRASAFAAKAASNIA